MHLIKAHGHGKVTYKDGKSFSGKFIDGKLQETGQIEIVNIDKSVYKGTWRDRVLEGQGNLTYANGVSIVSVFKDTYTIGKAKVSF